MGVEAAQELSVLLRSPVYAWWWLVVVCVAAASMLIPAACCRAAPGPLVRGRTIVAVASAAVAVSPAGAETALGAAVQVEHSV